MALLDQLPELLASPPAEGWQSKHFAGLDQLHIGGLAATKQLLAWLPETARKGLDMGGGLGGCARMLALEHACSMTVSDLDEGYIAAGKLLNQHLQPLPDCQYVTANSLSLPFAEQCFDFVLSQHAMMPIGDKQQVLSEACRVVKTGGYLLLHEVYLAPQAQAGEVAYPTPWANQLAHSHLQTWQAFVDTCEQQGWQLVQTEDETQQSLAWITQARANAAKQSNPLNARLALGPEAGRMSANVMANLRNGLLEVRRALLRKV